MVSVSRGQVEERAGGLFLDRTGPWRLFWRGRHPDFPAVPP